MISAQKLFADHTSHVVLCKLLQEMIADSEIAARECLQNEDEEIEALSLSRKPLSCMPHSKARGSPTEQVVYRIQTIKSGQDMVLKQRQLQIVIHYIRLYLSDNWSYCFAKVDFSACTAFV